MSSVAAFLASTEFFGVMPEAELGHAADSFETVRLSTGEALIRQGETEDSLYLIQSGRLRVSLRGPTGGSVEMAECGPGDCVGERTLLTGEARSADVVTIGPTVVLKLTRAGYQELCGRFPESMARVARMLGWRLRRSQLGLALHQSELFGALFGGLEGERLMLEDLIAELDPAILRGGEALFRQGDDGDALYIVLSGRLRVTARNEAAEERELAQLGRGETVGEMALVTGQKRSASVYGVRDTLLARLSGEGYERLLNKHPRATSLLFTKRIAARLHREIGISRPRAEKLNTVAVVPVSPGPVSPGPVSPGVVSPGAVPQGAVPQDLDVSGICRKLTQALQRFDSAIHVSSATVDAMAGRPGAAQISEGDASHSWLVERLANLEAANSVVVYEADAGDSEWTRRAIRQADHVLLVGTGSEPVSPGPVESGLLHSAARRITGKRLTLLLLHPDSTRVPSGTARWLEGRDLTQHLHVREDSLEDIERLARILTGRAVGVVFGGGFARGLAHAGVIRALRESGIPIDFCGGTSMGGIIAAEYAVGYDAERILKVNHTAVPRCMTGATLPLVALLTGQRASDVIQEFLEGRDTQMEDLWLPCFCVSVNLTRSEMKVHTRGSVLKALLATSRAPGVFPPIVWDGDLLADGGIIDNVPADVMKEFSGGAKVIAVDVSPQVDPAMTADYGHGVSGWRMLAHKLNPFARKGPEAPNVLSILLRTIEFGGGLHKRRALGAADVYICPPLEHFRRNDFERGPEMAQVAYEFTRKLIAEGRFQGIAGPTPGQENSPPKAG